MKPALDELERRGADVLLVGGPVGSGFPTFRRLNIGSLLSDFLTPMLTVLPLQLFALHLGLSRGLDPDKPSGLAKVTRTL